MSYLPSYRSGDEPTRRDDDDRRAWRERRERERTERRERDSRAQFLSAADRDRIRAERLERLRAERAERNRLARERTERDRLERERRDFERLEHERLERERVEHERLEFERLERERFERERFERERRDREQVELERLERERLERERLERERGERVERERAERSERLRLERAERDRLERDRLDRERRERERLEVERLERERLVRLDRERREHEEAQRRDRERLERERLERERLERDRLERERAERDRIERERLERIERERDRPAAVVTLPPAPAPARVERGPKEWLVAPQAMFRMLGPAAKVETPTPKVESTETSAPVETRSASATSATASPSGEREPRKARNLLGRAGRVMIRKLNSAKNGRLDDGDPEWLWFLVMSVGSICMALMVWGAYSAMPKYGALHTPLRGEPLSSKLKTVGSDHIRASYEPIAQGPLPPPFVAPPPPVVPPVSNVSLPGPLLPPIPAPPAPIGVPELPPRPIDGPPIPTIEPPTKPLPTRPEPLIFVNAASGETPMIRNWKTLADCSFLVAALAAPAAPAVAQVVPPIPIPQPQAPAVNHAKEIEALTNAVNSLTKQVSGSEIKLDEKLSNLKIELNERMSKIKFEAPKLDNTELQLFSTRLESLEKAIDRMMRTPMAQAQVPAPAPAAPVERVNLDDIKLKLGSIEQAILRLQPAEKRISLAPPPETGLTPPKAADARVILVNLYNHDLYLWVNQKVHRVPANTTKTLDNVPAGQTTIEVRSPEGVHHRATPTLVANETFTLTAR